MVVKIVSWNVNKRALWAELGEVDVALLQEAPRPGADDVRAVVPGAGEPWTTFGWTTAHRTCVVGLSREIDVVARPVREAHEEGDALGVSRRGTIALADVVREGRVLFTVASVYSAWERVRGWEFADGSAHRILSDLAPLLTHRRTDPPLLVAGDWNLMRGHAEQGFEFWAPRYASVFQRADDMGLVDVGPRARDGSRQADPRPDEISAESRNVPTFRHSRQTPETATRQLDYVFASRGLADRVDVRAVNEPDAWGPSDHCRVEITVDV